MDKYLENGNPSISEVREWGYDGNLYFMQQDEDLALHSAKYIPILIELASDNRCPKNGYCLSILAYYSQRQLAAKYIIIIEEILNHINAFQELKNSKIEKWKSNFLYLSNLILNPKEISETQADEIAFNLTVGDYCLRDFKKLRTLSSGYIEYLASTDSYKEYFYINPNTSDWILSRYSQLTEISNKK